MYSVPPGRRRACMTNSIRLRILKNNDTTMIISPPTRFLPLLAIEYIACDGRQAQDHDDIDFAAQRQTEGDGGDEPAFPVKR